MQNILVILILILVFPVCDLYTQDIVIHDFDSFEPYLNQQNDTIYVVNFWATWCIPCVKELPDFERINREYKSEKFRMLLVSLDFKSQVKKSVIPFIKERNIESEVVLLSDPNSNEWINKVNTDWTGSIPATIIYNKDFYYFHEGSMTYNELKKLISKNIKK